MVLVPKVSLSLNMKLSPLGTMAASNADMSSATLYEHHLGSPLSENVPAAQEDTTQEELAEC